jgi:hypothetical protein
VKFVPDIERNPSLWAARSYRDVSPGNTGHELERKEKMLRPPTRPPSQPLPLLSELIKESKVASMHNEQTIANEVFIGRTVQGHRIFANIVVREHLEEHETVDHEKVDHFKSLSFTWEMRALGRRDIAADGAGASWSVEAIVLPAKGWSMESLRRLAEIAREWHLSDVQAGCAHMRKIGLGNYDDNKHQVCPESGYRYGTKWLVKIVPDELIKEVASMFGVAVPA